MERTGNTIIDRFGIECDEFTKTVGALDYTVNTVCGKKSDMPEIVVARFTFSGFTARFIYNVSVASTKSVLELRISFSPTDASPDFSLYDLLYLLDENDYNCYIFPYIESAERMAACFGALSSALVRYKAQIGAISADEKIRTRAENRRRREMRRYFRTDIFEEPHEDGDLLFKWQLGAYREWYISRFFAGWYIDYLDGNYDRAAKKFDKYDNKSDYEIRLLRYIKALGSGAENNAVTDECNSYKVGNKAFRTGTFLSYLIAFIIFLPVFFIMYSGFFLLTYFVIYHNALFCSSLYSITAIIVPSMCALISSLFASYFAHGHFIGKKEKEKRESTTDIFRTDADRRSLSALFNFVMVVSLVSIAIAAKSGIALYDSGIVDNTSVITRKSESFSSMSAITDNGDGNYIITFRDGEKYECSSATAKKYILPRTSVKIENKQ